MPTLHTIYHSGFGHTKLQAQATHRGASSVSGVQAHLWTVEEAIARIDDLDQTDAMIFGCPTYMGSRRSGQWHRASAWNRDKLRRLVTWRPRKLTAAESPKLPYAG